MIIGDYTTQCVGDCNNNPRTGNPYNPTRIKWNDRGMLNTAQLNNVTKTRINHPMFDGLYLFMVMTWGWFMIVLTTLHYGNK